MGARLIHSDRNLELKCLTFAPDANFSGVEMPVKGGQVSGEDCLRRVKARERGDVEVGAI
jgi:hypothetical protein